jgi:hypothetical protein
VLAGNGVLAQGAAGAAGANLQFNLFSAVVGKHFGGFQLTAGAYVLDNHHLIPQKAAVVVGTSGGAGSGGGSESTTLERFPTQVQAFVGAQYVLGSHSELAAEFFPRKPFDESFGTTGVRWLLGSDRPSGPLALDRVRVRLDLAALWMYVPQYQSVRDGSTRGGFAVPLPWVGLGLYKL